MMTMGRYAAFLTALLSALFLVFQQSSYSNSNNVFCRGDREASRGEFVEPCHRHGRRPAGLYRQGEKSVGRRNREIVIGRRGGPIGRRRELFRPLLGALSFLFWVFAFVFVFSVSFVLLSARVFKKMAARFATLDTFLFFRRRRYVYIYILTR